MWNVVSEALPLGDVLVRAESQYSGRIAVALPGEEYSYQQLLDDSIVVARGLLAMGVERGENVGIIAPNSYEFTVGLFGSALIGAVCVPLSVRSTPRELSYVIQHAELKVLLATDLIREHVDTVGRIQEALPGLVDSAAAEPLTLDDAPKLRHVALLRGEARPGVLGKMQFEEFADRMTVSEVDVARSRVRIRDAALILYTSGTTKNPKGCLISHETISRGGLARPLAAFPVERGGKRLVMWCAPPLFHSAAIQGLLFCVHLGGTFVTDMYLDGDRVLAMVRKYGVNSLWGMFMAAMRSLMDADGFDAREFGHVHSMMSVGTPADLMELQETFPNAQLVNGLGMTEVTGWYCLSDPDDTHEERARTQGKPVRGAELRIVDPETGQEVPDGVAGELFIRTYTAMLGYFRDDEMTQQTIDEHGWLRTGDLVTRRPTGHIAFQGRIKDMLKVGGENVPTAEIESYLTEHSDVVVAEVVGVPDARLEEVPVAFVQVTRDSSVTEQELIDFCRQGLASFKIPRAIHFKKDGEWPMSSTKISKVALRAEAVDAPRDVSKNATR